MKKFILADVKVGDRFVKATEMSYNDGERRHEIHRIKYVLEVTKIHGTNADYKIVEVLENVNPPSWVTDGCGCLGGGFSIIADVFKYNRMLQTKRGK